MNQSKLQSLFPYLFVRRPKPKKKPPVAHNELLEGRYDVAFDVVWESLTPCALNPCQDENEKPSPPGDAEKYLGYNKRWLTYGGHFVISPFTVKSAIGNAFTNLLGGCYRVNTLVERHKSVEKGQYPYLGNYKRYWVAMDGSSKPGIIESIKKLPSNDREVVIQPIEEYFLDGLGKLQNRIPQVNETFYVKIKKRGFRPPIITEIRKNPPQNGGDWLRVKYLCEFRYGIDQKKHSSHTHRFYREKGQKVRGTIPEYYFLSKDELKNRVTLGGTDQEGNQKEHYQDLRYLKEGSFVYFEVMAGNKIHIGKNFIFKATFHYEEAVPEEQRQCKDLSSLCPRCSMFGLTEKETESEEKEKHRPHGYKGRFRASALISDVGFVNEDGFEIRKIEGMEVCLKKWTGEKGEVLARQILLPIMGPPKPNKRDVDGYYIKSRDPNFPDAGLIKGAKVYRHGELKDAFDLEKIKGNFETSGKAKDTNQREGLRSFAQVLEPGVKFHGTVGAENCTADEVAAFLLILNSSFSGHHFKLGLAKAYGMGSFSSKIKSIWIRRREDYADWEKIDLSNLNELEVLEKLDKKISHAYFALKKIDSALNKLEKGKILPLSYPTAGRNYWEEANKSGLKVLCPRNDPGSKSLPS